MSLVATLIANPRRPVLSASLADRAMTAIGATAVNWLADGIAADIAPVSEIAEEEARSVLADALAGEPLDIVVQPSAGRRKKLLLADMDSTMIDQECIDELADEVGLKDRVAAITARSMNGEIAFEPALRERVALLAGLETSVIDRILKNRITLAAG